MCRLAGIIDFTSPPTEHAMKVMRDAQIHGGPDDSGLYMDEDMPVAFGFRRLSFQDLSLLGHQPMSDDDNKVILMFNGEIYNFKILRAELKKCGYDFRSTSDTEVILNAYLEWGIESFRRFNGMFAIVLFDKRTNKIILARDHAGIKPLYYSIDPDKGRLYFASEVRAFKKIRPDWPENKDWRKYFLLFGHLPEPITTLQNVKPLGKATILEIDLPGFKQRMHKSSTFYFNYSINSKEEALERINTTLTAAVERHLISDAPIGLFLSGGLDSSLLTILAKRAIPNNLHTLSIVFEDEKYSEKYYQDLVIKATNARHRSYLVTEKDFKEHLPNILLAMDQPSSDGINSYFISKYAREYGLKAALSGIGADEVFGGYGSFSRTGIVNSVSWMPKALFGLAGIFPDDRRKKFKFLGIKNGLGEYLFNRGFFAPSAISNLLDCDEKEVDLLLEELSSRLPVFTEKLYPAERVSYMERNFYMQNQLLKDTDYMSMWHGLEVRVPFLDKELIELAYVIHPDVRYNKEKPKHLLIDAFRNDVPAEIWDRPKQGFSFPLERWMLSVWPRDNNRNGVTMHDRLINGNVHWSRYWSYVLTQGGVHVAR